VAASAYGVSRPSGHEQYQSDDEKDDSQDHDEMGEGESGDEAGENESQHDKDDSEDDHDDYLVSVRMLWSGGVPGSMIERVIWLGPQPVWRCLRPSGASFGARAGMRS
jgi:hypothetical protein